jgi:hypothetical protein
MPAYLDSFTAAGQATAPTNGAAITTLSNLAPGLYDVGVQVNHGGTVDNTHLTALELRRNGASYVQLLATTGAEVASLRRVSVPAAAGAVVGNLSVNATAAFAGGSQIAARITASRVGWGNRRARLLGT